MVLILNILLNLLQIYIINLQMNLKILVIQYKSQTKILTSKILRMKFVIIWINLN